MEPRNPGTDRADDRSRAMAVYHLNLSECGKVTPDEGGTEFETLDGAREAAVQGARDLMAAEIKEGRLCLGCCIIITDDSGTEAARVLFRDAVTVSALRD
jgi:hypothetical protein